jgi:membrane protease YdiL (CAAX protease family)
MSAAAIPNVLARASAPSSRPRRDLIELTLGYALILLVIWTPRPWQKPLYWATALFLLAVFSASFRGWSAMGLRTVNFVRSLWVVGLAAIASAAAVLLAAHAGTLQPSGGPIRFLQRYWGYALWTFVQQVLLQDFILLRLVRVQRSAGVAAFTAAAIFSFAHLPNPVLTVLTFVWGLVACLVFLRYRNLYTLSIAHAILGITVAITLPAPVIRNMRVGLGYLSYHRRRVYRSAADIPLPRTQIPLAAD